MLCAMLRSWARRSPKAIAVFSIVLMVFGPSLAMAADNTATGSIAGVDADLNDSNTFTLNSTVLSLVKAAFLSNGTALTSGASVSKGTTVKFLVYVDNTTSSVADSINVSDVLNAAFVYQTGTIKVDVSQNTGATAASIYAAVNAAAAVTDAVSGADVAGITGSTISAGNVAGNALVTVPASKVWAMLYTVKVQ
jgi:hypothetical protein